MKVISIFQYDYHQSIWTFLAVVSRVDLVEEHVTLDHKTSLKSLGYICSNSQKYIEWVQNYRFFFYAKNH